MRDVEVFAPRLAARDHGAVTNVDDPRGDREQRRDSALARLRARGERVTAGRRAVIDVLLDAEGHLDAEAIAALVDDVEPGVHRATVYRSLQALVEVGVVTHTHVPGGATIYHLSPIADEGAPGAAVGARSSDDVGGARGRHGHAHLQCVVCQRFTDVDAVEFAALSARIEELTGFALDPEHGALLGTCAPCREAAES